MAEWLGVSMARYLSPSGSVLREGQNARRESPRASCLWWPPLVFVVASRGRSSGSGGSVRGVRRRDELGVFGRHVRTVVARERVLIRDDRPAILDRELVLP